MTEMRTLNPPEKSRTYYYPNGEMFMIQEVVALGVSASGNHRVESASGRKFIVMAGFFAIEIDTPAWSF